MPDAPGEIRIARYHPVDPDALASSGKTEIGFIWGTAKPELIEAIEDTDSEGGWVFFPTGGHPNPPGYTAYAKAAVRLYERMKAD